MTQQHPAVGIDLGTTYSVVAHIDHSGRPVTLPNNSGDLLTPSAIFVDDIEVVIGKEAVRASVMRPEAYAECFKRDLGSATFRREICGFMVPPEVLSAFILERLKDDAGQRLGRALQKVVITVPAFFDENRRTMTYTAGRLAGLEVMDIINEPTAAAVAYGSEHGFLTAPDESGDKKPLKLLIYDLGGGTFDVTVLEANGTRCKTLATDGDVRLGGKDFDKRIVNYLAERFVEAHGVDPRSDPQDAAQLWIDAQEAKHALSERNKTSVVCFHAGIRMRIEFSRSEFAELTADLVERTETTASLVIRQAGLEWSNIDRVLLVGGSTRMPMIRDMLRNVTGKEPICSLSPDEVVAHGAALYAQDLIARESGSQGAACDLVNVNSHSLGVVGTEASTGRKTNVVLIPKNTQLPARASKVFSTAKANQRSIRVQIVEGESDRPEECISLGECVVQGLPPGLKKREKILVEYSYAANGRISVLARVPSVRHSAHVEIERSRVPSQVSLDSWRRKLLGKPDVDTPRFQASTIDLDGHDSVQQRLDQLLTRLGRAAMRCPVPEPLAASHKSAFDAVGEAEKATVQADKAKRAMNATLHDPKSLQQGASVSQAETAMKQAQVRADFACLVLGRECIENDFMPTGCDAELREIQQLQLQLARLDRDS